MQSFWMQGMMQVVLWELEDQQMEALKKSTVLFRKKESSSS